MNLEGQISSWKMKEENKIRKLICVGRTVSQKYTFEGQNHLMTKISGFSVACSFFNLNLQGSKLLNDYNVI